MSKTGRAAVYDAPNEPFVIRDYPVRDVHADEVLVKVTMSTICRSDIHSYQGHRPNPCPGILGHEIVGVIEQLGADMVHDMRGDKLATGDRVTWTEFFHHGESYYRDVHDMPQKSDGVRKYGHDLAEEDPHFLGGFAEYCYIQPGTGILKLPDAITDEEATPLNCGVATMISVTEAAEIDVGDTVVVHGLGLLGLYGCAIAKARGARRVIGVDAVADRLDIAKKFGADATFDVSAMSEDDLVSAVRAECPPDGADVGLEVCGFAGVVPVGVRMLRVGGCFVIGGLVNPDANFEIDGNQILKKMITLKGVHNYHPRHLIQALDFVMSNRDRYPFGDIVDSKFSLDQLDEAFARAADRSVLRAAIVP
ncbi:MAG: zinc-binding dehydrogenase [Rhodospirillaceae bacterium]|nr:zinc-binding dehydrogenase [Rhodospirillaceae bacterium]MBT6883537.1 zinc-binding dehydrogenase [Rhodospirillaceae bacterium]MBT7509238.1 zinc-binding dehydrogenase [Rhodospirillaceae bacterium]